HCRRATITFCLDRVPVEKVSWLSNWSVPRRAYEQFRKKLVALADVQALTELLPRSATRSRFADNPILRHLEHYWAEPRIYASELARNPELETGNWKPGISNPKQGTLNFELGTQNPEHGTRNTQHGTRSTEHGPRNTEHRTSNSEHRMQD